MMPFVGIWDFLNQYFNPFKVIWDGIFFALSAFAFTGGALYLLRHKIIGDKSTFLMRWLKRLYILLVSIAALFFGFKIGIIYGLQKEVVSHMPVYLKPADEIFKENILREMGDMQHYSAAQYIDETADMIYRQQLILLEKGRQFGLPDAIAGGFKYLGERQIFAKYTKTIIRLLLKTQLKLRGETSKDMMEHSLKELADGGLLSKIAAAYVDFIALIAILYSALIFSAVIILPPLVKWTVIYFIRRIKKKNSKPRKK